MEHKGISIVITNNKGGVAKTTSVAALAILLSRTDKKVLVVDADMQTNLTSLFKIGRVKSTLANYLTSVIRDINDGKDKFKSPAEFISETRYKNVDLIAGDVGLNETLANELIRASMNYDNLMQILLDDIKAFDKYDYIFIDTPPSMGVFATNFLFASDYALIPAAPSTHDIEAAIKVSYFIKQRSARRKIAKNLGIFFTRVDERTSAAKNIPALKKDITDIGFECFDISIPQSSDVVNAATEHQSVVDRYPSSKATKKYQILKEEMERKIGQ